MTQKIDLPINEALSEILNRLDPEEYRKVLLVIDDFIINTLKIDATQFDNSFKNNQNDGMYCLVNNVSNAKINCMGICQYDDKCKAFSIDNLNNCMFFNKVESSSDKTNYLSNNFYIKKN